MTAIKKDQQEMKAKIDSLITVNVNITNINKFTQLLSIILWKTLIFWARAWSEHRLVCYTRDPGSIFGRIEIFVYS